MPQEYKVLIAGPMGAGKTTLIGSVSDSPPVSTEVENLDREGYDKDTTTVAMDFGEVALAGGDRLRLYGTPGQSRFRFMWEVLSEGALGVVLLVDNSRADPRADLLALLDSFGPVIAKSSGVVGVTRLTERPRPDIAEYADWLAKAGYDIPAFAVDPRRRADSLLLLEALLHQIEGALLRGEGLVVGGGLSP